MELVEIKKELQNKAEKFGLSGIQKSVNKNLVHHIDKFFPETKDKMSKSEKCYVILNDAFDEMFCKRGNKFSFDTIKTGYSQGCRKNCECIKEIMSESLKETKSKISEEDKEKANKLRSESIKITINNKITTFEKRQLTDIEILEECRIAIDKLENDNYRTTLHIYEEQTNLIYNLKNKFGDDIKITELLYLGINGEKDRICKFGNNKIFHNFENGYKKYCSPNSSICHCRSM